MKEIKSNPSKIVKVYIENTKTEIMVVTNNEAKLVKLTEISIMDRYSNGSYIVKDKIVNSYLLVNNITGKGKEVKEIKELNLKEIDDKIMTIDDLLNNTQK